MKFSRATLVRLSQVMGDVLSHTDIDNLFYEHDVQKHDPGPGGRLGVNRTKRSLAFIQIICETRDEKAAEAILLDTANSTLSNPFQRERFPGLLGALSMNGFEWVGDRLVISTPDAAPLAEEITAIEVELKQQNISVAASHYRQAVDNYTNGNFEACNGQLRAFLEDLFKTAAASVGLKQVAAAQTALDHLRGQKIIDDEEWAIFRALWNGAQDNGPHAGLSDGDEALFRLHTGTAAGRYLLKKLP